MGLPIGHHAFDVLVIFVDHTDCQWLKLLKSGFRHCFTAIRFDNHWIICDPLKSRFEIHLIDAPNDFNLAGFYADQGHTVIAGFKSAHTPLNRVTCEPFTCVAMTKRILGLQSFWLWTPWQLFLHLVGTPRPD
ncbi:MAG: hypothetical protein ACR2Q4_13505, partial [Geminicoccaceae bacterium]